MRPALRSLLPMLLLVLWVGPAPATVVLETSVEDMTRVSTLVVHGEVLSVGSYTREGTRMQIVTEVALRVIEVLKGEHEEASLVFTLPGGRVGDYTMRIPGMPRFRAGEEVVLFLERTSDGFAISGMQQGRFLVMTEPVSGMKVALRSFGAGLALAHRDETGRLVMTPGHGVTDHRPLHELRGEVREVVRVYGPRPEIPRGGRLPERPELPDVPRP